MVYSGFFSVLTGNAPYPYQERLACEPWPDFLDLLSGLAGGANQYPRAITALAERTPQEMREKHA